MIKFFIYSVIFLLCYLNQAKCTIFIECNNNNYMSCLPVEQPNGHNPYLEAVNQSRWMRQRAYGYLEVRPGVHLFYQLFYANGTKEGAANNPLIIWIQGGPGFAASGIGNFAEIGPLDMNFKPRNHTWNSSVDILVLVTNLAKDAQTYREIEALLGISGTTIQKILHEALGVRKLVCRWIPHLLSDEHKVARVRWCKKTLQRFNRGESNHVYDVISGDESWIYAYDPDSKQQSTIWVFQDEPKPTKVFRSRSTSKKLVATFVGKAGHVATIALEDRRTVNAEWYTTVCLPQVKTRNVLLIDHPVGVGFSYSTRDTSLAQTDREVAMDLSKAVRLFLRKRKEFRSTPTYIVGQSYGGKISARLTAYLNKAIKARGLKMNLKGVAIGGGWVNPKESILMQPEFLYLTGSIDRNIYLEAKNLSRRLANMIERRSYKEASTFDSELFQTLNQHGEINFNNVNTFNPYKALDYLSTKVNLYVKPTLKNVNQTLQWKYLSSQAYHTLKNHFLVPSYTFLERLLNSSNIKIVVYNGNLDVVTPVSGASNWVHKLRWAGSKTFAKMARIEINGFRNGYYKVWKQLSFWTVFGAGHWVPQENPEAMEHILNYLTLDEQ